jgi:hypothetical protein
MKAGVFMLTKSEQRVVILVVVALLGAAFVRYWREETNSHPAPNRIEETNVNATPFSSPQDAELDADEPIGTPRVNRHKTASPSSSP